MAHIPTPNLLEVACNAWNSRERIKVYSSTGQFLVEGIPIEHRGVPTVVLHYEDDNDVLLQFKDYCWQDVYCLPN